MFTKKPAEKTGLERAREDALDVLNDYAPVDDEYKTILKRVVTLSNLMEKEAPEKLSINALLPVIGTIASVVVIVGYEQRQVLTSKALQFLPKLLK